MTNANHPKNLTRRSFIGETGAVAAGLVLLPGISLAKLKKRRRTPVLTVLERTTEPLLKADRPWEDYSIGCCGVLKIGDQWHLWYVAFDHGYKTDNDCYLCYARSNDGINWEKPSLGIYTYKGSTDNNILMFGFNLCSFIYDEKAPPEERFKGVGSTTTWRWVRSVVGLWGNIAGWNPLETNRGAITQKKLRHRKYLHSRWQHIPALRADVE